MPKKQAVEKYYIYFSQLILLLYWFPYLILNKNGHYLIHDNLDSIFVWYKVIIDNKQIFAPNSALIDSFMCGMPRQCFPSELNFTTLWFYLLGPLNAYIFERIIVLFVAFWGMYALLSDNIINIKISTLAKTCVSISFAFLPFWPFGGLSVAGAPLLFHAFLNINKKNKIILSMVIIVLFPFYSSLVLTGIFLLMIVALFLFYDYVRTKTTKYMNVLGYSLLILSYMITNYRLLIAQFMPSLYVSHRIEFNTRPLDFIVALKKAVSLYIYGHYHSLSLQTPFISLAVLLCVLLCWKVVRKDLLLILCFLYISFTSLIYGFEDWRFVHSAKQSLFSLFPLQMRFYWLHPVFWSVLFAKSIVPMFSRFKYGCHLGYSILFLQVIFSCTYHECWKNRNTPTFREFYSEELFSEVKNSIDMPIEQYRVISVGMHPAVSQYNGFKTVDGYLPDYPIEYKKMFRKIIENNLEINIERKRYYDEWGSRVYVYLDEDIGFMNQKDNPKKAIELKIDYEVLRKLNCRYIISAVQLIENDNLKFKRKYESSSSCWIIFLYEINERPIDAFQKMSF